MASIGDNVNVEKMACHEGVCGVDDSRFTPSFQLTMVDAMTLAGREIIKTRLY